MDQRSTANEANNDNLLRDKDSGEISSPREGRSSHLVIENGSQCGAETRDTYTEHNVDHYAGAGEKYPIKEEDPCTDILLAKITLAIPSSYQSGAKDLECIQRQAVFQSKARLKRHQKIHTDDKHQCNLCSATFNHEVI